MEKAREKPVLVIVARKGAKELVRNLREYKLRGHATCEEYPSFEELHNRVVYRASLRRPDLFLTYQTVNSPDDGIEAAIMYSGQFPIVLGVEDRDYVESRLPRFPKSNIIHWRDDFAIEARVRNILGLKAA